MGTLGRGFLEELTTSWLLSFPLLARGAREDSVSQPDVHMHMPEENVLHLPYLGHPNTWQVHVHVGAVVHVGMWIRCFQALCVPGLDVSPPFPPCPGKRRHPLQSPLGSLAKLGGLVFLCAAAVSHRPGQGLLGSLILLRQYFQSLMVRLILAGHETWVSHRHVLGWGGML